MPIKLLLTTLALTFAQSSACAQQVTAANSADEFGTSMLVYSLIIAVYGLYWLKQKA